MIYFYNYSNKDTNEIYSAFYEVGKALTEKKACFFEQGTSEVIVESKSSAYLRNPKLSLKIKLNANGNGLIHF